MTDRIPPAARPSSNGHHKAAVAKPSRFSFIDSAAFAAGDFRPEWYVKNVFVKGEPGVLGGPMKVLRLCLLNRVRA